MLADTQANALKMAAAVSVSHEPIDKPILTIKQAIENNSFHVEPGPKDAFKIGDPAGT